MDQPILKVENLSKRFFAPVTLSGLAHLHRQKPAPVIALDCLSFTLSKGKTLGLLGSNGAGKTTLLKTIATLLLPDKGSVMVNGYRTGTDDLHIKACTGLATPEERSFYWRLSGRQNLDFFAALYGLNRRQRQETLEKLFSAFSVTYQEQRFDSYSTGMKRKFSIIRSLLHDPALLLLDEPTKSLDYHAANEVRHYLKNISAGGKTIVIATHDIHEAEQLCDTFLIMHNGTMCGIGTLPQLQAAERLPNATLTELYARMIKNVQ